MTIAVLEPSQLPHSLPAHFQKVAKLKATSKCWLKELAFLFDLTGESLTDKYIYDSLRWQGSPSIPEWAKLPQYKEQAAKFFQVKDVEVKDVEMEGIEVALEQKLVIRRGLRRKRSDVSYNTVQCTPIHAK